MNSRKPFLNLSLFKNIIQRASKNQQEACFNPKSYFFYNFIYWGGISHLLYLEFFQTWTLLLKSMAIHFMAKVWRHILCIFTCHLYCHMLYGGWSVRTWSHSLKKSLMENFFCAVTCVDGGQKQLFLGVQQNSFSEKSHQFAKKISIS